MILVKWLQSLLGQVNPPNPGSIPESTKGGEGVSEGEILAHSAEWNALVRWGFHNVRLRRLKRRIQKKVVDHLAADYVEPKIVEEVTDRILQAAVIDPHYQRLFADDESV